MRITSQLRIISGIAIAMLAALVPALLWTFMEFRSANKDFALADAIKLSFFERASFGDQYFLYREDRALEQWDKSNAKSEALLRQAKSQFKSEEARHELEGLRRNIEESAETFHRIVNNTAVLKTSVENRRVYEELDKRLFSQLLLKAVAARDAATALKNSSAERVNQAYEHLAVITGLFALALGFTTILISMRLRRLIRQRLAPLHAGARIVADGNLDYRIDCNGADEFAELALSVNIMTERLQIFTRRLEAEIGAHEQAEGLLRKERDFIDAVLDTAGVLVIVIDRDGKIVRFNRAAERFTGYRFDEIRDRPFFWESFLPPEQRQGVYTVFEGIKVGKVSPYYENHWLNRAGERRLFAWVNTLLNDADERMEFLIAIGTDITEHKKAEEKLQLSASVFTHAREGITITSADGTIIDVNDAFTRITGYSRAEVLGKNPRILSSGRQSKEYYAAMWRDLIEKGSWYGEIWNRRKDDEVYAEMLAISAVRDVQGKTRQYVALFSDITSLKEHQTQLEHIAHYDALTALPNRVLLGDRLHQGMVQAQRRGQRLAVVYLDLDGFKAINDSHGHDAGDQLLMTASARMKLALREGDTLARLGGDEFVAVLLDLPDIEAGVPLLNRLLVAAAQPVQVAGVALQVSASLGVTFYPQTDDVDADQLLRQADQAMYQAKLAGKNRYHVFDTEQDRNIRGYHESMDHIRRALAEREFVLYYQPKVNMRSGAVIGAEALIRWQHPEKGLLPPAMFLPVIENHPLALEIGEWVIDAALKQMKQWSDAGLEMPVSVNVGAYQLLQDNFIERLRAILALHPDIDPGMLEIEVLETSALEDVAKASQVIEACREIGVQFALDDFGTGYSSLTYLKRLPVTLLKIDQSFVRDMLDDPDDLAILEGVIGLSRAFRRQVIAEGVETVEHGVMLLRLGCELAQGYGIARPMPAAQLPGWTVSWRSDSTWVGLPSISRDDLPLLFAGVEHRAWIVAVEAFLKGERETPPPLDHHQCRFGAWVEGEGMARHGTQAAFRAIKPLHLQVHALAARLLELQSQDRNTDLRAMLDELHAVRDTLLDQVRALAE